MTDPRNLKSATAARRLKVWAMVKERPSDRDVDLAADLGVSWGTFKTDLVWLRRNGARIPKRQSGMRKKT